MLVESQSSSLPTTREIRQSTSISNSMFTNTDTIRATQQLTMKITNSTQYTEMNSSFTYSTSTFSKEQTHIFLHIVLKLISIIAAQYSKTSITTGYDPSTTQQSIEMMISSQPRQQSKSHFHVVILYCCID